MESPENIDAERRKRTGRFAETLNPLFWNADFNKVHRMFEWVCTLIRVTGLQDTGWDSYTESVALLEDFTRLQTIVLPDDLFPAPDNTRVRLALFAYSHLLEMNMPYDLLTNLLSLRLGRPYVIRPLAHLDRIEGGKKKPKRVVPASPAAKIDFIAALSVEAGLPDVGLALRGIYDPINRNAIFHSDYALHDNSLRLLTASRISTRNNLRTPLIPFDELAEVINAAFDFHSALLHLWRRQRSLFGDFRGKILPYDSAYKGVLEFTFDGDLLDGFRTYWPNGMIGEYRRHADGRSGGQNLSFRCDGSVDFFIGMYAMNPGTFSPLVESDGMPNYAVIPGTASRPHWPLDHRPYPIEE